MKSRFVITLIALLALFVTGCEKEDDITYESLPTESKTFLSTYFENIPVSRIEKKHDNPRYTVKLDNGFTIFFYGEGGCQCVNGDGTNIPQGVLYSLLPGSVTTYIYTHYPETAVTLVSVEDYGYYTELGTRPVVALKFDREGGVITLVYK